MKNVILISLVSSFLWIPVTINAQEQKKNSQETIVQKGCFADKNNNKVCDKFEKGACGKAKNYKETHSLDNKSCDGSGYSAEQKKKLARKELQSKAKSAKKQL